MACSWIWLNCPKGDLYRKEMSNLAHFSLGGNFLKNGLITFLYSHNYWYYSVVTNQVASLVWNLKIIPSCNRVYFILSFATPGQIQWFKHMLFAGCIYVAPHPRSNTSTRCFVYKYKQIPPCLIRIFINRLARLSQTSQYNPYAWLYITGPMIPVCITIGLYGR